MNSEQTHKLNSIPPFRAGSDTSCTFYTEEEPLFSYRPLSANNGIIRHLLLRNMLHILALLLNNPQVF